MGKVSERGGTEVERERASEMNEIGKGREGAGESWRGVNTLSDFAVVHWSIAVVLEPLHLRAVAQSHLRRLVRSCVRASRRGR
eukprot:6196291-Pleurochrysis_carterae.AAC.1